MQPALSKIFYLFLRIVLLYCSLNKLSKTLKTEYGIVITTWPNWSLYNNGIMQLLIPGMSTVQIVYFN
jgi:hypothetical protein